MGAPGTQMVQEITCAIPRTSQPQKGPGVRSKTTVRIVVQDFRVGVFAHFQDCLPLLANSSQPGFGQPGVVGQWCDVRGKGGWASRGSSTGLRPWSVGQQEFHIPLSSEVGKG